MFSECVPKKLPSLGLQPPRGIPPWLTWGSQSHQGCHIYLPTHSCVCVCVCVCVYFFLFTVAPAAYGNYQARGQMRAEAHTTAAATLDPSELKSVTYATAWSNTGSLAHRMRPGIEPESSQRQCRVLNPLSHDGNSINLCIFG